jgi:cell division protein FtsB
MAAVFWAKAAGRATLPAVHSRRLVQQRLLPLLLLGVAVISVPVMIFSPTGLAHLRALEEEKRRVDEEVSRLSAEIQEYRVKVRRIKEDPAFVERAARDELGLVRQTEVVFQFKQ